MQWQVNYTYARNWDDDSNERNFSRQITLNPFDLAAELAPSKQGRNTFRQPDFFNLDLRVRKAVRLAGSREMQFLVDVLNATRASNKNFANDSISVFGTPASPVATAGQPLFAPSTARFGGPRQVQLGVKVSF